MKNAGQDLPESLSLEEAYRTFYLVRDYLRLDPDPSADLSLLLLYMWTDPARWDDWCAAVRTALTDGGAANPDRDGTMSDSERLEMPL